MTVTRRSNRLSGSNSSGSPESRRKPFNVSGSVDHVGDEEGEEEDGPPQAYSSRGRPLKKPLNYADMEDEDDDDDMPVKKRPKSKTRRSSTDFVVHDDDDEDADGDYNATRPSPRRRRMVLNNLSARRARESAEADARKTRRLPSRGKNKARAADSYAGVRDGSEEYNDDEADEDDDLDVDMDDDGAKEESEEEGQAEEPKKYALRTRKKTINYNYNLFQPAELRDGFGRKVSRKVGGSGGSGSVAGVSGLGSRPKGKGRASDGLATIPWGAKGKDYDRFFGGNEDSSSDDDLPNAPRGTGLGSASLGGGLGGGGLLPGGGTAAAAGSGGLVDFGGGAGSSNLGRIRPGGDPVGDIDPLGVNMQVSFDGIGGLDGHIQRLKEMVSLPLLYPEVFQRFGVTPPRGVLFHGPPGTGKTLLARALAASCSTEGQQISFFMRKGADALSKWVGEAERQLRLLFEEARRCQPSIIFFDEIDGLAPVRSSKQEQIHASIVSTLLALMDGMDGRGQVIVIGATNRPDNIDPALRRPGRFDREFYFPLPNREARKKIIEIQTKGWNPPLGDKFVDRLAEITKGFGGADLRALCTEAALNAIQRKYPQIYKTTDRLVLDPSKIDVQAKDFMISAQNLIPSSARSTSSVAAPLPSHLEPLLGPALKLAKVAMNKILPEVKKRNPLEEAEWEPAEDTAGDGGFSHEMMLQSFDTLRVFRPRMLVHGDEGMGQSFLGAAIMHHLEGFHVQSLDIGTLMGDPARTPEAAVVQLFAEAKRHKPSVLFIPGLRHWAETVTESVRNTTRALLDNLAPSDPIMLLAVLDGSLKDLPRDVRTWFGLLKDNKDQRKAFFSELLSHIERPPDQFPDAVPRKRRVLEELPKAPPRPPRMPSKEELQQQEESDARLLEYLKFRLNIVFNELKKKAHKFRKSILEDMDFDNPSFVVERKGEEVIITVHPPAQPPAKTTGPAGTTGPAEVTGPAGTTGPAEVTGPNGENGEAVVMLDLPERAPTVTATAETALNGDVVVQAEATVQEGAVAAAPPSQTQPGPNGVSAHPATPPPETVPQYQPQVHTMYDVDLEKMHRKLYDSAYLTVEAFLQDLDKIVTNAAIFVGDGEGTDVELLLKAQAMRTNANILVDQNFELAFRQECQRMADRQAQRMAAKKAARKRAKEEAAAAALPHKPAGTRHSARNSGEAPEFSLQDPLLVERENKRLKRSSVEASSDDAESEGLRKRARTENSVEPQLPAGSIGSQVQSHSPGTSGPLFVSMNAESAATTSSSENYQPGPPPVLDDTGGVAVAEQVGSVLDPAQPSAPSPPSHPAFNLSPHVLAELTSLLVESTDDLTVEELEQLRAASFDMVWHHRSEWDRDGLVRRLVELSTEFLDQVREDRSRAALADE